MHLPRSRSFWAAALAHMTNDVFMSMGPVLLTFFSAHLLPISNTEIGIAISAQQLAGAVSQPLFGWWADRGGWRRGRWLGAVGVMWVIGGVLLSVALATTGQFWLMMIPFALAALGSGAFHPVGTALAADDDATYAASNLSIFFLLGQSGLALGPAVVGLLLDQANPAGTAATNVLPVLLLGLIALPLPLLLGLALRGRDEAAPQPAAASDTTDRPRASWPVRGLLLLALMVTLRGLANPGVVTFIPRLFQQQGWDPTQYGLITSSFWIASGVAGVVFGQLADRFDRRLIVGASLLLAVPALFLLPVAEGQALSFALAIILGGLTGGSHSVIVVLAQDLIPARKGFASGVALGFIFASGAFGSLIIGGLSDSLGLNSAFQIIAGVTVAAGLLALLLPAGQRTPPEPVEPLPVPAQAK
ncbi:MAG: MFS transporter [Anaerolineae bacterium]|nr:MFS transporter [Anaerolineae bacterium]